MNINEFRLKDKRFCLVVKPDEFESDDEFLDAVAFSLNSGVKMIQLYSNNIIASRLVALGKKMRELCSIYSALFILSERIDVAQLVDADGIHLEQDSVSVFDAKELLGAEKIVGISVETIEQVEEVQSSCVDYAFSKLQDENDFENLNVVSKNIEIPFFVSVDNLDNNISKLQKLGINRFFADANITDNKVINKSIIERLEK